MPSHAPNNYQSEPKNIRSNCGLQMSLLSGVNQTNHQDNIIPAQIHHNANHYDLSEQEELLSGNMILLCVDVKTLCFHIMFN